jgi:hypothetical protein
MNIPPALIYDQCNTGWILSECTLRYGSFERTIRGSAMCLPILCTCVFPYSAGCTGWHTSLWTVERSALQKSSLHQRQSTERCESASHSSSLGPNVQWRWGQGLQYSSMLTPNCRVKESSLQRLHCFAWSSSYLFAGLSAWTGHFNLAHLQNYRRYPIFVGITLHAKVWTWRQYGLVHCFYNVYQTFIATPFVCTEYDRKPIMSLATTGRATCGGYEQVYRWRDHLCLDTEVYDDHQKCIVRVVQL